MPNPKKVLIVAYYWPPAGGPGVQRWLKFVKYLPDFGIKPIVYVPENPSYPITDQDLWQELPEGVQVIKRPIKEPYRFASMLSRKQTNAISSGLVPKAKKQSVMQKLLLYIRGNYFIPDARVAWVKPSISYLEEILQQEEINTIITTGPPHSMHLIGLGIKKRLPTIRWIADFRDPWTTIGYHDQLKMTPKTQQKHKSMELEVLQTADEIIVTSPRTKLEFSEITKSPITVITNGFDVPENDKIELNNKFIISHIGSLLSDRNPNLLWKVLAKILKKNYTFSEHLVICLAGRVSESVLMSLKQHNLDSYVQLEGYVSHTTAIELQRKSNVLLLLEIDAPQNRSIIPGKLFEYLAARRPILAIGPKGSDIEEIIENTDSGSYHNYTEEEEIRKAILSHFTHFMNKSEELQSGEISKYHRRTLTETLSKSILS